MGHADPRRLTRDTERRLARLKRKGWIVEEDRTYMVTDHKEEDYE